MGAKESGSGERRRSCCEPTGAKRAVPSNGKDLTVVIMPRNKKTQVSGLRLGAAVKTVLLCVLIGGSCVGYALQNNKIHSLAQTYKQKEVELEKLKAANAELARQLAALQLPQHLAARVMELELGLVSPTADQIIWLPEPRLAGDLKLTEESSESTRVAARRGEK